MSLWVWVWVLVWVRVSPWKHYRVPVCKLRGSQTGHQQFRRLKSATNIALFSKSLPASVKRSRCDVFLEFLRTPQTTAKKTAAWIAITASCVSCQTKLSLYLRFEEKRRFAPLLSVVFTYFHDFDLGNLKLFFNFFPYFALIILVDFIFVPTLN